MNTQRPDWYSDRKPINPKADIAEYVRRETAIAVPTIFETLEDGLHFVHSGGSIILRSESPDQYEGPSGIFQSYVITPESLASDIEYWAENGQGAELSDREIGYAAVRGGIFDKGGLRFMPRPGIFATAEDAGQATTYHRLLVQQRWSTFPNMYCRLAGMPIEQYMADNSFSVFEYIPGSNITIVADSAVAKRWHVYGTSRSTSAGWLRVNGDIIDERGGSSDQLEQRCQEIVAAYEEIRQLAHFNTEHCPVMEMQLGTDGKLYFLQYHRARDFKEALGELNPGDYPASEGWIRAEGVRGELAQQALDMTLHYPTNFDLQRKLKVYLTTEQASANMNNHPIADEVLGRNRLLRVAPHGSTTLHGECADGHMSRSGWFKAQSGLILPRGILKEAVTTADYDRILDTTYQSFTEMAALAVEAAADGNTGYIRIDRDKGQNGIVTTELQVQ